MPLLFANPGQGLNFTTIAPPATSPNQFSFTPVADATSGDIVASNTILVGGINTPAPVSIAGGDYSINGGPFTSGPGLVMNGNTVQLRVTAPSTATLTIGTISAAFVVTLGEVIVPPPDDEYQQSFRHYVITTAFDMDALQVMGSIEPYSLDFGWLFDFNGFNPGTCTITQTSYGIITRVAQDGAKVSFDYQHAGGTTVLTVHFPTDNNTRDFKTRIRVAEPGATHA